MNRKAQQIVEYLLLIASVMVVFLAVSGPNGMIRWRVEDSINRTINLIKKGDTPPSTAYYWVKVNCNCAGQRDCVYPGVSEVFVSCTYRCVKNGTGATVDDFFCIDLLGYKPNSLGGCGNGPCCGNTRVDAAYGEQCDPSAGFTQTCSTRHTLTDPARNTWAGTVQCNQCRIVDTCVEVENPAIAPVCGDNRLQSAERCDMVNGRPVFNPAYVSNTSCIGRNTPVAPIVAFTGGSLGCSSSCRVDVSQCYRCPTSWTDVGCGTNNTASLPNPTARAHCFKNGTKYQEHTCRWGTNPSTTFVEGRCTADPNCGNQCINRVAHSTVCPLTMPSSYTIGDHWSYVDAPVNCGMNTICQASCNNELVATTDGLGCYCEVANTVYNSGTGRCDCPSGFVHTTNRDAACDVYREWLPPTPDVYGVWSAAVSAASCLDAAVPTDTCDADKVTDYQCPADTAKTCADSTCVPLYHSSVSYYSRTVTCVNPPLETTYNRRSVTCLAPRATYTRTAVRCLDPDPQATYGFINVTCDSVGGHTYSALNSATVAGTCALNLPADTCNGDRSNSFTCAADGSNDGLSCVDIVNCADGLGPDPDTYTFQASVDIQNTCVGGSQTDTCDGNISAAYTCTAGNRNCRDIVCTNTDPGNDTYTNDPSNPLMVTGVTCTGAPADTCSGDRSSTYTCGALEERSCVDISSCATVDPGAGGAGDTYVNATAPATWTGTCGKCVTGTCVDEPVGCTQGTCPETPLTDTCNSDKAGAYTCGSAEAKTCTDVVCAAAANVNYAKYSTRSITCNALGADTCNNNRSAEYACPDSTRKTCVDVLSNPPTFEGYRNVTCRTYNGTSCVAP